jgi:hypothetical protein
LCGGIAVRVAATLAEHDGCDQTGDTGIDVHHGATGEIEHAPVPHQAAVAAPHHVCDRRIDEGEPERHEHQHGREFHALGESADDQGRRDDREGQLEGDEYALGIA